MTLLSRRKKKTRNDRWKIKRNLFIARKKSKRMARVVGAMCKRALSGGKIRDSNIKIE